MHVIDKSLWFGRDDTTHYPDAKRIHHIIQPFERGQSASGWVLIGYACDQGVEENQGRIGAKSGPDAIRRMLGNMAWHADMELFDAGNITSNAYPTVVEQQQALSTSVYQALHSGHRVIVLGGGHDLSYGSWKGLSQIDSDQKTCVINFDAHFDLRCPDMDPNSGTGFYQILHESQASKNPSDYVCLGIAASANTRDLFMRAQQWRARYLTDIQCQHIDLDSYLTQTTQKYNKLHVSVDLDVMPAEQAPGVSAPASLGVDKNIIFKAVRHLLATNKVHVLDIAEYNPTYDLDARTARLAATLVHMVLHKDMYNNDPTTPDKITHRL